MEKRTSPRQPQDAAITFSRFNAQDGYDAQMVNYSRDGMYFETNQLLPENTDIFFRVEKCDLHTIDKQVSAGFRTISLARVKWWRPLNGNSTHHRFGIGVKYY